jgi:hypothetical protein
LQQQQNQSKWIDETKLLPLLLNYNLQSRIEHVIGLYKKRKGFRTIQKDRVAEMMWARIPKRAKE